MSEQTPEPTATATDEDGFAAAESEPSMEDILASIRKIISDDADPLPLDGPGVDTATAANPVENSLPVAALVVDPVADIATDLSGATDVSGTMDLSETMDLSGTNDGSFDLDALFSDLDDIETPASQSGSFAGVRGITDMDARDDDLTIPELEAEASPAGRLVETISDDEDDMDRLMNELLVNMDEVTEVTQTEASVAAATQPGTISPSAISDDNDMDIVKSLMADLTDDDVEPATAAVSSDDLDSDLDAMMNEIANFDIDPVSAADVETPAQAPSVSDDIDALEDDIFDSILEMTLDDEVEAFDATSEAGLSAPSLADIAAAADAEALTDPSSPVEIAAIAAAETANPSAKSVKPETAKPAPSEMETPMPSALRSDAILDEVTEKASMTAFAELNQVVEDKAILSERGPRIGDLVQDALKPMLKEWLDANIQSIVERAVAKEVKRIADGK